MSAAVAVSISTVALRHSVPPKILYGKRGEILD